MNNCNDKIKQRCTKVEAECVRYNRELPSFSELTDCISIAETTEEQYVLIGEIKEEIDLTTLDYDCGTLPTDKNVKSLIQFLLDRDCAREELIETIQGHIETLQSQVDSLQENNCP
jgi:hypothetical protein